MRDPNPSHNSCNEVYVDLGLCASLTNDSPRSQVKLPDAILTFVSVWRGSNYILEEEQFKAFKAGDIILLILATFSTANIK